jgi:transmembrane sensor
MVRKDPYEVIDRYLKGEATSEEAAVLENWFYEEVKEPPVYIDMEQFELSKMRVWNRLVQVGAIEFQPTAPVIPIWKKLVAAAVIAAGIMVIWFAVANRQDIKREVADNEVILPGGNKALLKLTLNKQIDLTAANSGILKQFEDVIISKQDSAQIVYQVRNSKECTAEVFDTLSTPNGGQYRIKLSDNSIVVLNSATTLIYPRIFKGDGRQIQLTGEAYFEVAGDASRPFRIKTLNQSVDVIGTKFNIRAYPDEPILTTLADGAVSVKLNDDLTTQRILKPGQQSISTSTGIIVKEIKTENAYSWKNRVFVFSQKPIRDALREISRWYNVKVDYESIPSKVTLNGNMLMDQPLEDLLKGIGHLSNLNLVVRNGTIVSLP